MALTDAVVRGAKPGEKRRRLADGRGLYLELTPEGGRWWRFRYRFRGRENMLSLGTYPETTLAKARQRRDEARALLAEGIDPSVQRRRAKLQQAELTANSFEAVARDWFARWSTICAPSHAKRVLARLEQDVFPRLGHRPIAEIDPPELLRELRRIESRGAIETAHRVRQTCGMIFRYAIASGRAVRDPTPDLRGALTPVNPERQAALTDPKAVGELLRAIDGYRGTLIVKAALQLAPLVFVRPGELRAAEWCEFDFDAAVWTIPARRMKLPTARKNDPRFDHQVPLSTQALAILKTLRPVTGRGRLVFPSMRGKDRPMSENTANAALRRLGYTREEMTGHGWRAVATTLLNEQNWDKDAIERQLGHAEPSKVHKAYHRAEYLDERRRMMQAWADYLDGLRRART